MSRPITTSPMCFLAVAGLLVTGCSTPATQTTPPVSTSDPRAIAIAREVMDALGGQQRWDTLVGLRWTFESAVGDTMRPGRRHAWDKSTGWHRVEGRNRQGQPFVMIDQIGGAAGGMALMDGHSIEGDSLQKLMRRAKSLWTNDTYWMLMPYKLLDPGVRLTHDGEVREGDIVYDKLSLSFDHVGETPGDRYWVFVNRANHRIEKWEYILEGDTPPAEVWTWEGWEEHEGLWFPTAHRNGETVIYTRAIETVASFPEGTFTRP